MQLHQNMGEEVGGYLLSLLKPQHFLKMERLHHTFMCIVLDGIGSTDPYLISLSRFNKPREKAGFITPNGLWNGNWDPEMLSDLSTIHKPAQCPRSLAAVLLFIPSLPSASNALSPMTWVTHPWWGMMWTHTLSTSHNTAVLPWKGCFQMDSYMQNNETRWPTYTIHKNKFKVEKRQILLMIP